MVNKKNPIINHQEALKRCRRCPAMIPPVITCQPVESKILLIGQAPGIKEGDIGKPFAWTAGKTLFKWFDSIGVDEKRFRDRVYMSAVCRCFPGKNPKGGDRVPDQKEIDNCSRWLQAEFKLLQPDLVLLVGGLAIRQFMEARKLSDVIGQSFRHEIHNRNVDVIPLPHPSGASTWHRVEPGITLLQKALCLIESHPLWSNVKSE